MLTPFLSFKGTTQENLLKISITHNKNLNPLLNLLIKCVSTKSAPHVFFLITGLCNPSTNCSLFKADVFSKVAKPLTKDFYQKICKP